MARLEAALGSEIVPDFVVLFMRPFELLGLSCTQTIGGLVAGASMLGSLATTLCAAHFLVKIEVITGPGEEPPESMASTAQVRGQE
jgi:hypothetical protein